MSFSDLTLVYDCGFGGCQAPVRPTPIFCPGPSDSREDDKVGQPIWNSTVWLEYDIAIPASVTIEDLQRLSVPMFDRGNAIGRGHAPFGVSTIPNQSPRGFFLEAAFLIFNDGFFISLKYRILLSNF